MKNTKTTTIAIYAGLIAVIIGAVTFALNWNLYDVLSGPIPGFYVLLFPGNITLIYIWHPLFTEEINFWPKFALLMFGQFSVVTVVTMFCVALVRKWIFQIKKPKPDSQG